MANYYQPSGKVSALSYLFLILSIIIVFPILGLAYSYAIWYIPFIYLNFIITVAVGLVAGYYIRYVILFLGKVRNTKMAIAIAVIASLSLYYVSWAIYTDLQMNILDTGGQMSFFVPTSMDMDETIGFALHPSRIFSMMGALYRWGSWGVFGFTMSGIMLALVWIAEFLIITVIAVTISYDVAKRPFCELSNQWFKEKKIGPFVYVLDRPALTGKIENSDRTSFDELEFTDNDQRDHNIFIVYNNEQGKIFLTAESHKARMNDGDLEFDITPFIERIEITEDMKQRLLAKMGS